MIRQNKLYLIQLYSMIRLILVMAAILLFLPNLIKKDINERLPFDHREKFDPELSYINSINKLEKHIDSIAASHSVSLHSLEYAVIVEEAIEKRFYHGFSHQMLSENWIAAVSERLFHYGLSCKVDPEEIMQNPNAACSQQSMVMMEILRRKRITYRSVGFPHHFAMEAMVEKKWYYLDANMEPDLSQKDRLEENWSANTDSLKKYYDKSRFNDLDFKFGNACKPSFSSLNDKPAKNAKLFQTVTKYASRLLWIFPLLIIFFRSRTV